MSRGDYLLTSFDTLRRSSMGHRLVRDPTTEMTGATADGTVPAIVTFEAMGIRTGEGCLCLVEAWLHVYPCRCLLSTTIIQIKLTNASSAVSCQGGLSC